VLDVEVANLLQPIDCPAHPAFAGSRLARQPHLIGKSGAGVLVNAAADHHGQADI